MLNAAATRQHRSGVAVRSFTWLPLLTLRSEVNQNDGRRRFLFPPPLPDAGYENLSEGQAVMPAPVQ